ncbi:MAG TPA: LLM class flavin-dependent oxidoreductase, partial [Ktedonobacterales bacterium]|nr:LLM class flavin-dependent oxidoreductase [Ktedonobacterales bacterium]
YRDIQAQAQLAEQVGFDSYWLADHLLYRFPPETPESGCWEVFTFLSALAATTSRITLGPLVACTSFRNPALLAKMADSLDEISDGRFILGLGAGWHKPEYDAFGYPFDHLASRFEEALAIILPLLRGERVTHHGKYYDAEDVVLRPRGPTKTGVPIWIGGRRPRMLELTARHANAWNTVWHKTAEGVKVAYPNMLKACEAVGRDPKTLMLTAGTFARVLAPGEARKEDGPTIQGEPEEVAEGLRAFAEEGVEHLVCHVEPDGSNGLLGVERFARVLELLDQ